MCYLHTVGAKAFFGSYLLWIFMIQIAIASKLKIKVISTYSLVPFNKNKIKLYKLFSNVRNYIL